MFLVSVRTPGPSGFKFDPDADRSHIHFNFSFQMHFLHANTTRLEGSEPCQAFARKGHHAPHMCRTHVLCRTNTLRHKVSARHARWTKLVLSRFPERYSFSHPLQPSVAKGECIKDISERRSRVLWFPVRDLKRLNQFTIIFQFMNLKFIN